MRRNKMSQDKGSNQEGREGQNICKSHGPRTRGRTKEGGEGQDTGGGRAEHAQKHKVPGHGIPDKERPPPWFGPLS